MTRTLARLALCAACTLGGTFAASESARADYYPWTVGYGYSYSTYYSPYAYNGYWYSGYSPYWTTSFYAPAYVSYAPACCAPACSSCGPACNSCGPVCCSCDPCGSACSTCSSGSCGLPASPGGSAKPEPKPDNGVPRTYEDEGKTPPADGFKPRKDDAAPAGDGAAGDADDKDAGNFEGFETRKPVTEEPTVIPQKEAAPATEPTDDKAASPNETKLGTPTTTPPSEKKDDADKKEDAQPEKPADGDAAPTALHLDSKITWRVAPARTRTPLRASIGAVPVVRQASRTSPSPAWVPVEHGTALVRK